MANSVIPCIPLPDVPQQLSVKLPFGELKGFHDFSLGIPSNCTVTFNLLLQLPPLLASLTCPLRVLKVIKALKDFANFPPSPSSVTGLIGAIDEMALCLPPVIFPQLICSIVDILRLILSFIKCLLDEMKSILDLRINISIGMMSAQDNPTLLAVLTCAEDNAKISMAHLGAATEPLQPLLDMVAEIASIVELPLNLPPLSGSISAGDDLKSIQDTIDNLDQFVTQLLQIIDAIPC